MWGTIVNAVAIIVGSTVGLLLHKKINPAHTKTVQQVIALAVIVVGVSNALEATQLLLVIGSLAIGTWLGEILRLDDHLQSFARKVEQRFSTSNFAHGFTSATMIYCVGPLAIFGAIESGLTNTHTTLYIKSMLDGITSIIFSSTMGIGVVFSSIPVFLYQGIITLFSNFMSSILVEQAILNMTGVGGVVIIGIGLNVLGITKIKLMNTTPALFIPILYYLIF